VSSLTNSFQNIDLRIFGEKLQLDDIFILRVYFKIYRTYVDILLEIDLEVPENGSSLMFLLISTN